MVKGKRKKIKNCLGNKEILRITHNVDRNV